MRKTIVSLSDKPTIIEPNVFGDSRGYFFESFNLRNFEKKVGRKVSFVQDNESKSSEYVLRGLHYQINHPQGKLVRVIQGKVFDVCVDMRKRSDSFGQWFGVELSGKNKKQFWVPPGFAHGFLVLSKSVIFSYKTTDYWFPEHERILRWNDKSVGISWPITDKPRLADKDANGQMLTDAETF